MNDTRRRRRPTEPVLSPVSGRASVLVGSFVAVMLTAASAHAELVFFGTGRSLSVKGHRTEGSSLVLELRSGGEIVCEPSLIARIEPDEVPYPDPPPPQRAANVSTVLDAVPYADLIDSLAQVHGVDPVLVKALIKVESGFNPRARSPKGAMGLMQIMPETAREYSLRRPYDPKANLETGIRHLKSLLDRFEVSLALAAYNAGEAAVKRFGGIPPYPETQDYVTRILALSKSKVQSSISN